MLRLCARPPAPRAVTCCIVSFPPHAGVAALDATLDGQGGMMSPDALMLKVRGPGGAPDRALMALVNERLRGHTLLLVAPKNTARWMSGRLVSVSAKPVGRKPAYVKRTEASVHRRKAAEAAQAPPPGSP